MPTTYNDQFWVMDPFNPPPVGTLLTVFDFDIIDQNDNDLINRFSNDSIDGSDIRASYPGDTVTVELSNGSIVTITGVTFYLADGREVFTPTDGSTLQDATLVSTTFVTSQASVPPVALEPICFAVGTLIETAQGPRRVEELVAGDLILTADKGLAPVRVVHEQILTPAHLRENPKHRPVRIVAGSMGEQLPNRDLVISPQHRMLVRSAVAQRMYGETEILVPACQLVGQPGISRVQDDNEIRYFHILLDHHAVIFAEGTPSETLFLGAQVHENLSPREVKMLRRHLPGGIENMQPARLLIRGARLKKLLERHSANDKPLLEQVSVPEKQPAPMLA